MLNVKRKSGEAPFFFEKVTRWEKITLVENNGIIACDVEINKTLNNYFINIIKELVVKVIDLYCYASNTENPVERSI